MLFRSFIAYVVLQAAVGPFWAASESVLNQRTLDSTENLQDRIVVREVVLWAFRMVALALFWMFSTKLSGAVLLAYGATMMAAAVVLQYGIARAWLKPRRKAPMVAQAI